MEVNVAVVDMKREFNINNFNRHTTTNGDKSSVRRNVNNFAF